MASTSAAPTNPDRPHQPSSPSIHPFADQLNSDHTGGGYESMNMEEIIKSIYVAETAAAAAAGGGSGGTDSCSSSGGGGGGNKMADEMWREIVSVEGASRDPEMTLEDFLTKAGAVREEDVRVPAIPPPSPPVTAPPGFKVDAIVTAANCPFPVAMQNGPGGYAVEPPPPPPPHMGFGNGVVAIGGNGGGRGKRRATIEEIPLDKATQQKQRRMIKNRESAARSRERKQAYTVELESLVTQLEEDNARLLREEAEQNKKRLKQLMENLIPVVEKRKPPRVLHRVHSMTW